MDNNLFNTGKESSGMPQDNNLSRRLSGRFCEACGKPLYEHEVFCSKCGHVLAEAAPVPPVPITAPDTQGYQGPAPLAPPAAIIPATVPQEPTPNEPVQTGESGYVQAQAASPEQASPPAEDDAAPSRPAKKTNWVVVGGIALFAVVIVALLAPGLFLKDSEAGGELSALSENEIPTAAINPADDNPGASTLRLPANEQQSILDMLEQSFPELLPGLVEQVMISDEPFIAAAKKAYYTDPVFDDYSLTVTLMLPDPRIESLGALGITTYTPRSGAREFIEINYEKLCRMEGITDWLEYPVTFVYQKDIGGESIIDPTLFPLYSALWDYSDVFKPHMDQFITEMGFYTAALELLMPVTGNWRTSEETESDQLRAYLADLADALEFKGIELDGKTVADKEVIIKTLEERLAPVFVCHSVSAYTDVFRQPQFKIRSVLRSSFLTLVYEKLDADYNTGRVENTSSLEDVENAFRIAAEEIADGIIESAAAGDTELLPESDYPFDWKTLGAVGVSACEELIEDIRYFLFVYDLNLRLLVR